MKGKLDKRRSEKRGQQEAWRRLVGCSRRNRIIGNKKPKYWGQKTELGELIADSERRMCIQDRNLSSWENS